MKKYNILITNHALEEFRGSETYCYTLCKELAKKHNIFVYTPKPGVVSKKMSEFADILTKPKGEFDIILYNHNNTLSPKFNSNCKIYTIHGIYPELEKPPGEIDIYVAISEEISMFYKDLSPVVIYNGIDTEKFRPVDKINTTRKNVLYSSNSKSRLSFILRFACLSLGLGYNRIGRKRSRKSDVVDDLKCADIVVGLGRTALEGLSCNKKVVVADKRFYTDFGMDGLLTLGNVNKSMKCNYSGRSFKNRISFLTIRKELKRAMKDTSTWERDWILKRHNISKIAGEYVNLAEKFKYARNFEV